MSKAGKTTQLTALKTKKKQARTDSLEEDIIGSDDVDEEEIGSLKAKGRSAKQKKRTSADMQESDNDTKPTVCKKTKQVAACINEDSFMAAAKTKPVKSAKQVPTDELSNESEEDAKPSVSKVKDDFFALFLSANLHVLSILGKNVIIHCSCSGSRVVIFIECLLTRFIFKNTPGHGCSNVG